MSQEKRLGKIEEIPPIMVLEEESPDRLLFRFRGGRWGAATLAGGLALITASGWFRFSKDLPFLQLAVFVFFGLLLLYSSLFSFTANQFLIVDGKSGSINFHKKNLYGRVDWKRSGDRFKEIRIFRPMAANHRPGKNWAIMLVCHDETNLFLGEHELGSRSRGSAFTLAENIGRLAGIRTIGE